jgi:hypothetical protein
MSTTETWTETETPVAESMTTWTNPTPHDQTVEILLTRPTRKTIVDDFGHQSVVKFDEQFAKRVTWAPGETKSIPSRFDRLVHVVVDCDHAECRRSICKSPTTAGPRAKVVAGSAPLLQRDGQRYSLDQSMIPIDPVARTMVAPADVASRMVAGPQLGEDLAMVRARARKAAGKQ